MQDTQAGLALFNAIATAGRTLYDIAQGTSKLETKQQLMEVYDTLMNLKREAAELEDENYRLKQQLRLKSDDFEFRDQLYYEKKYPDRPLCPKCFVENSRTSPMSDPYRGTRVVLRRCLVCSNEVVIEREGPSKPPGVHFSGRGPDSWMGR